MNLIFISIDSLNCHFLKAYGQTIEFEVATPTLDRFAQEGTLFENHYAGSLPCMPARREYFTGTQEFLWRPWGPIEPFDTTVALAARQAGVLTQLITDHYHYFQHGSHGYYEDYHGFEFIRGQEHDAWKTSSRHLDPILLKQMRAGKKDPFAFDNQVGYARNVASFKSEEDFFAPKVFSTATTWLEENSTQKPWLLVIDSFDVHEPFHCPEPYASMYTQENPHDPDLVIWPLYGRVDQGESRLTERQIAFVRAQYAGKLTMVDRWLGKLFEKLDQLHLWDDTTVIVTSDHGHYLGEHNWMGKPFFAPLYNTLAHTPLLIHFPKSLQQGKRIEALTSAVDVYATMLETLGVQASTSHSRSLLPLLKGETIRHRDWALYGYWGSTVNVTDGEYTYLHPCRTDVPVQCYSTMMMNFYDWFMSPQVQPNAEVGQFLPYTNAPVWRYPATSFTRHEEPLLFNIRDNPQQVENLVQKNIAQKKRMRELLVEALRQMEAPQEQYQRLALEGRKTIA